MKKPRVVRQVRAAKIRAVIAYQTDVFGWAELTFVDKGRKPCERCREVKPREHVASPFQLSLDLGIPGMNIRVSLTSATTGMRSKEFQVSIKSTEEGL